MNVLYPNLLNCFRIVGQRKLLELSEVEQELVSDGDHSTMLKQV